MGNQNSNQNEVRKSVGSLLKNLDKVNQIFKESDVQDNPSINVKLNGDFYQISFINDEVNPQNNKINLIRIPPGSMVEQQFYEPLGNKFEKIDKYVEKNKKKHNFSKTTPLSGKLNEDCDEKTEQIEIPKSAKKFNKKFEKQLNSIKSSIQKLNLDLVKANQNLKLQQINFCSRKQGVINLISPETNTERSESQNFNYSEKEIQELKKIDSEEINQSQLIKQAESQYQQVQNENSNVSQFSNDNSKIYKQSEFQELFRDIKIEDLQNNSKQIKENLRLEIPADILSQVQKSLQKPSTPSFYTNQQEDINDNFYDNINEQTKYFESKLVSDFQDPSQNQKYYKQSNQNQQNQNIFLTFKSLQTANSNPFDISSVNIDNYVIVPKDTPQLIKQTTSIYERQTIETSSSQHDKSKQQKSSVQIKELNQNKSKDTKQNHQNQLENNNQQRKCMSHRDTIDKNATKLYKDRKIREIYNKCNSYRGPAMSYKQQVSKQLAISNISNNDIQQLSQQQESKQKDLNTSIPYSTVKNLKNDKSLTKIQYLDISKDIQIVQSPNFKQMMSQLPNQFFLQKKEETNNNQQISMNKDNSSFNSNFASLINQDSSLLTKQSSFRDKDIHYIYDRNIKPQIQSSRNHNPNKDMLSKPFSDIANRKHSAPYTPFNFQNQQNSMIKSSQTSQNSPKNLYNIYSKNNNSTISPTDDPNAIKYFLAKSPSGSIKNSPRSNSNNNTSKISHNRSQSPHMIKITPQISPQHFQNNEKNQLYFGVSRVASNPNLGLNSQLRSKQTSPPNNRNSQKSSKDKGTKEQNKNLNKSKPNYLQKNKENYFSSTDKCQVKSNQNHNKSSQQSQEHKQQNQLQEKNFRNALNIVDNPLRYVQENILKNKQKQNQQQTQQYLDTSVLQNSLKNSHNVDTKNSDEILLKQDRGVRTLKYNRQQLKACENNLFGQYIENSQDKENMIDEIRSLEKKNSTRDKKTKKPGEIMVGKINLGHLIGGSDKKSGDYFIVLQLFLGFQDNKNRGLTYLNR